MDSGRAEAFSDGVFAVAITVLVFDLRLDGHGPLAHQFLGAWPHYFAYVVSFLTIGVMWMNHHTILGHISRVDRPLLVLNLLLLMGVVAIPFPTAVVAGHLLGPNAKVAAVAYGIVMIAISGGFASIWVYVATHGPQLGTVVPADALRRSIPGFTAGGAAYVAATLIAAFWSALVALIIYGVLAVYYLYEHLPSPGGELAASPDGELGPGPEPGG